MCSLWAFESFTSLGLGSADHVRLLAKVLTAGEVMADVEQAQGGMSRRALAILAPLPVHPLPLIPPTRTASMRKTRDTPDSGGADDTAVPPAPETCAPPSLRLVAEFGHMELADVAFFTRRWLWRPAGGAWRPST